MEIITGLWLAQAKQLENIDWCKSKKINCIMNFQKHFETQAPLDINYVYLDKVDNFCKASIELLYRSHYLENKNCLLACENGRRISLLVIIYYLSTISGVSRRRAYEIIKTKLPLFQLDSQLVRLIEGQ